MSGAVLVMAKEPVPGRVKTRLCPPCEPEQAAAIAEAALADTLAAVAACGAKRRVLALAGHPGPWLPPGVEVIAQEGRGLAERLSHAWRQVEGPCVQIGMDTPQVTSTDLDAALAAVVDGHDAVLGPATDGGWWALGLKEWPGDVFAGVSMSTDGTGAAQRARLEALGVQVTDLPALRDVDTFADALAVAAEGPGTGFAAEVARVRTALESRR